MSTKKKVLFTKELRLSAEVEEKLKSRADLIVSAGHEEKDLLSLVPHVHGIIAHGSLISEDIIRTAPLLKVIATPQVGFDKIDVSAATKAGVAVIANTGLAPTTVAEFTIGLMIALSRRIVQADFDLRQKRDWSIREIYANPSLEMGYDVYGSTVGLVGLGTIGSVVARLCKAVFSSRVIAYDPFISLTEMANQGVEKSENLLDLAKQVDFLSLHMTLTSETRHIVNEDILHAMKPKAYLINCSRGAVVDQKALEKALNNKWIAGAAIDVFEDEPISPLSPLLTMRNVILTPHIAGITHQSSDERGDEIVRRLIDIFDGKKPAGLVNPEVWARYIDK